VTTPAAQGAPAPAGNPSPATKSQESKAPAQGTQPRADERPGERPGGVAGEKRTLADQVKKPEQRPADTAEETAARKEAERRRYKLRLEGKELEEELSDDEVSVRLQRAHAAEKRIHEANSLKQQFEEALKYGKENPVEAFEKLFGVKFDQLAESRLQSRYEEAILPEHEQEKLKLQRELDGLKKREADRVQQEQMRARQEFEQQVQADTEREFIDAMERGGFEKNRAVLAMMADVAELNLQHGIDLTPDQLVAETKRRMTTMAKHVLPSLKGPKLLEFLGEDAVREVVRAKLDAMKLTPPEPEPQVAQPPAPPEKRKPMTPSEFRRKHLFGIG